MDLEFMQIENHSGWHGIFQKLHQISRTNAGSQSLARKPMNVIRNRYRDVLPTVVQVGLRVPTPLAERASQFCLALPVDATRVKLSDPDNDYINANHVQVEDVNRGYILTQGPLEHTCPHFWQMIWDNNSSGIVMLNKCVERGSNKCYPYWPHSEDPPLEVGKFRIENLDCQEETSYRLSHLKLENVETQESRVIMHFHYTRWPDFGVPQNPEVFLQFLYAVRSSGVLKDMVKPCVVHCSAGIGRTGTFCLVDVLLAKLESTRDFTTVNLQSVLLKMREQRLGLIQTPDQLRFSYIAILQGSIQDLQLVPSSYEGMSDDDDSDDDVEDDDLEESDSDAEDENERLERKYPHLNRQYGHESVRVHDVDDVPPPLPPRPPETLSRSPLPSEEEDSDEEYEKQILPPLPPTSSPPGPPMTHIVTEVKEGASEEQEEEAEVQQVVKKRKISMEDDLFADLESGEEYGFKIAQNVVHQIRMPENNFENGEVEELEQLANKSDLVPPPVPPRNLSLSPSPCQGSVNDLSNGAGHVDIYGSNSSIENSGSFLGEGRGGVSPPLGKNEVANDNDTEIPPPLPAKSGRRKPSQPTKKLQNIEEEEKALISELDELEKLVSRDSTELTQTVVEPLDNVRQSAIKVVNPRLANGGVALTQLSTSELRRRQEREAKRDRLENKVQLIKEHMRESENEVDSDWSVPWLLVGFVAVLGYCVYYVLH